MFSNIGASKFGTFVLVTGSGCVSGTWNEIISTMLDTSFLILSGSTVGRSLPVIFKLHKYIAKANSGKNSLPDLVESDKILVLSAVYSQNAQYVDPPYLREIRSRELRPQKQLFCFFACGSKSEIRRVQVAEEDALTIHCLVVANCRLEQLFKLGLILRCNKR